MELPEQLRFTDMSKPYSSVLYSNKTQPVSFSQSQVRFEIPKAGIMSSTAIVEYSFTPNQVLTDATALSASGGGTFPINIGSSAGIRRAVLSTQSGRVIMDNRDFNKKQVVEKSFRDGDYNHFIAPYLDLSWFTYKYTDPILEVAGKMRNTGVPKTALGVDSLDGTDWSVPDVLKLGGVGSPPAQQSVRVSLQELFPFLYNLQLPLIMMEQLYLDIYWETDREGQVFLPASDVSATYAGGGVFNQADCFLLTDNIVYTDPAVMDAIFQKQEQDGGLSFPYTDYAVQTISHQNLLASVESESYERELGASNYKLTDIKNIELIGLGGADSASNLFGKYYSNGRQSRHLQLVLNDSNFYPDNKASQMENFTRLSEIYNFTSPYIPRPVYALSNTIATSGLSNDTFMGFDMQLAQAGGMNPLGIQLRDDAGRFFQNGNAPIRLFYEKTKTTASSDDWDTDSLQYFFVGYLRTFMVSQSGKVIVSERA
jgi:hypothetical protein